MVLLDRRGASRRIAIGWHGDACNGGAIAPARLCGDSLGAPYNAPHPRARRRGSSISSVSAQTSASTRSGEWPSRQPVGAEVAHLVLERGEARRHAHPALRVERRHRLGAQPFAARRPHRASPARAGSTCAITAAHHVAALVDLGDDAVGLEPAIQRRPRARAQAAGCAPLDASRRPAPRPAVAVQPRHDDAAGVRALAPTSPAGRPPRRCAAAAPAPRRQRLEASARVHSASGAVLDQLAVEFLPPEPRAAIARHARAPRKPGARLRGIVAPSSCRVTTVAGSASSRFSSGVGRGVVVTSWRGRVAEPQAELQHVPGRLGVASIWPARRTRRRRTAARAGSPDPPTENTCATAPFGQTQPAPRRPRSAAARAGRPRAMPETPSIITSRTSASVSPTSAMRPVAPAPAKTGGDPGASPCTHSAPAASCRRRARRSSARVRLGTMDDLLIA